MAAKKNLFYLFILSLLNIMLVLAPSLAFAGAALELSGAGGGGTATIGTLSSNLKGTFANLAQLITAGAYIAGMGFGLAAILKFKAHKDNPTQIPVGTPIALLFIAAALLFLPSIFNISGGTLFGSSGSVGGITGVTTF